MLTLALTACQSPPPVLSERDLMRAMTVDIFGEVPDDLDLAQLSGSDGIHCVDLNRAVVSFARDAARMASAERWKRRLGLEKHFTEWEMFNSPTGDGQRRHVDPALNTRLQNAANQAVLNLDAKAPTPLEPPWPDSCETRYWFQKPTYSGEFAFIETGSTIGGFVGSGSVFAFEYQNDRWLLVAQHTTWTA